MYISLTAKNRTVAENIEKQIEAELLAHMK